MNVKDNIYRYRQADSSINALFNIAAGYTLDDTFSMDILKQCADRTYIYINSQNEMCGIIGIYEINIRDPKYYKIIPTLKLYPKGTHIYCIEFINGSDDLIDGFGRYNILYNLISEAVIVSDDRPIIYITNKSIMESDKTLYSALKNNKFSIYHDCQEDYNVMIRYPNGMNL